MIQDIFPHIYHNEYHNISPKPESIALYYEKDALLLARDESKFWKNSEDTPDAKPGAPVFPRFSDLEKAFRRKEAPGADGESSAADAAASLYENAVYLFTIDDDEFFLVNELASVPTGFYMEKIAVLVNRDDHYPQFAAVTGRQLYDWYRDRKYCGRCGRPLKKDTKEHMLYCECGQIEYPKISPAVIVAVTNGSKILLSRYSGRNYTRFGLTAGFCEIGESVENTVCREVMEEVGLHVKNIRFYKSQPWSFSNSVLIGFFCEVDGSDSITIDTNELAEAVWVERKDIPTEERGGNSLTEEMINFFRDNKVYF